MVLPARRQRFKKYQKTKNRRKINSKIIFVLALLLTFFVLLFFGFSHFRKESKFTLVSREENGDVLVINVDRNISRITIVRIPGDTEVDVAKELGVWRLKSVWQLGINEKIGGQLLAETVIKNFHFPIYAWTDSLGAGLTSDNLTSILKALIIPYDTNLGFGDKVRLAFFSLGLKNLDRGEVDLSQSSYLRETKLKDGERGFEIFGQIPQKLLPVFADPYIAGKGTKIVIINTSGEEYLSQMLGATLGTLGGKVVATFERNETDINCEISGKDSLIEHKINLFLGCKTTKSEPEGNYDLEILIGREFAKRF